MPRELIDNPKQTTFSFPGLQDKSIVEIMSEPIEIPKKAKKEPETAVVGRKPLKLGKSKG